MKNWIVLFALGFSLNAFAQSLWDLNDVSYLMPLPETLGSDQLLQLRTPARGGDLLEPRWVEEMPRLAMGITEAQILNQLRVVGVRIDPCFPLPTPLDCQRQVRLVWQILAKDRQNQITSIDAALHSFYVLTEREFKSLLSEIQAWKTKHQVQTAGKPLQIHPAWSEAKDQSPALHDFQKILTRYIGAENLIRVTNMLLRGAGDMWAFQTFEFRDGLFEMQKIPRLKDSLVQTFINFAVPADHFGGQGMTPLPSGKETVNLISSDSKAFENGNEDILLREFEVVVKIENPKAFNAENMDCVSCHVAQPLKHWALNKRGGPRLTETLALTEYKNSKFNLQNLSTQAASTKNLRAFGYFGNQMALSQRVIHESADVAEILNEASNP